MSPCISTSDRRGLLRGLAAAGLVVAAPGVAFAQPAPAQPTCQAMDEALPPEFAAWRTKAEVVSATSAMGLAAATLRPGQAAQVALHGTREVAYPAQPAKPGGSVAHGGLVRVLVDKAGTYRVALSSGAWIDMVRDGTLVVSTAHGHGPACSTIRKMVEYPLEPGAYVLQISANADPALAVLVAPVP
jgi:hypothetical protein